MNLGPCTFKLIKAITAWSELYNFSVQNPVSPPASSVHMILYFKPSRQLFHNSKSSLKNFSAIPKSHKRSKNSLQYILSALVSSPSPLYLVPCFPNAWMSGTTTSTHWYRYFSSILLKPSPLRRPHNIDDPSSLERRHTKRFLETHINQ